MAEADQEELLGLGRAAHGRDSVAALPEGGVAVHGQKVLAGRARHSQVIDVGIEVVGQFFAVALAGQIIAVVKAGDGGVAHHPDGGLFGLVLAPGLAPGAGVAAGEGLADLVEQQQAVHINRAVGVAGGLAAGVQAPEPEAGSRGLVGRGVVAGLGLGVPIVVGAAVDVGAGLALQLDLLGNVLAVGAEGEDALGLIAGGGGLVAGVQGHVVAAVVEAGGVVDLDVQA